VPQAWFFQGKDPFGGPKDFEFFFAILIAFEHLCKKCTLYIVFLKVHLSNDAFMPIDQKINQKNGLTYFFTY
jgi:hypothetical protein